MSLFLATPTGSVTSLKNGIIIVQCKDFIGPARGTLTTISDPLSVVGTVIEDSQTIPVQTTNTSINQQFGLVDDSMRVDVVSLPLETDVDYRIYVGARVTGSPPSNALSRVTALTYGNDVSTGVAGFFGWGIQDAGGSGYKNAPFRRIANGNIPYYVIYYIGQWFRESETYMKLRGWGVTGGNDQTTLFDVLYFVPISELGSPPDPEWTSEDFILSARYLPLNFGINGTLLTDEDDDSTSASWLGAHSVLTWGDPWTDQQEGQVDFQESEDESTAFNNANTEWDGSGTPPWGTIPDPYAYLAFISGLSHVPDLAIVTETFPSFVLDTNWFIPGPGGWIYKSSDNYVVAGSLGGFVGNHSGSAVVGSGWEPMSGGFFRCYFPQNQDGNDQQQNIVWGQSEIAGFAGESTLDPRTHKPTIQCENGVLTARIKSDTVQQTSFAVGMHKFHSSVASQTPTMAVLEIDGSGNLTLALRTAQSNPINIDSTWAGPTSVGSGYSANDEWWVKVEKRGYHWRAKAWADGDTEPDWQIEGQEPMFSTAAAGVEEISYPYDDSWNDGDPDHDQVLFDPRGYISVARKNCFPFVRAWPGANLAEAALDLLEFKMNYDSGNGTPGNTHAKVYKYDDSVVFDNEITIPYGSHRWVYGLAKKRRFNLGEDTYNIRVWKDSSNPTLSPAILGHVWERRLHAVPGPVHLEPIRFRTYEEES